MSLQQDMKFPTSCSNGGRFRLLLLRRIAQVFLSEPFLFTDADLVP